MAAIYVDENFPASVVIALRQAGHNLLTAEDDGRSQQGIDDDDVLARATVLGRAVLTFDRWDFHRLHSADPNHAGIITCTDDADRPALASRVDAAICIYGTLSGQLIRVVRPPKP